MNKLFTLFSLVGFLTFAKTLSAQDWQVIDQTSIRSVGSRDIIPIDYIIARTNPDSIKNILWKAPIEDLITGNSGGIEINIMLLNGVIDKFKVFEYLMMEPGLIQKYPGIKTFKGNSISNNFRKIRIDWTESGFRAIVTEPGLTIYIDPFQRNDTSNRIIYSVKDILLQSEFKCQIDGVINKYKPKSNRNLIGDCIFRSYRIAIATTGEYSNYFGATSSSQSGLVLSEVTTAINRINEVFESDVAVRLLLISNTDLLFFYIPQDDPYTGDACNHLDQNQSTTTNIIGSSNYDIGHVFGSAMENNGCAGVGVICSNSDKARGATLKTPPTGDPFYIDYVAHEIGHQFGAHHIQNNNCNRHLETAMEPGSGSTVMGYAGICAPNVQNQSDDYFHSISLQEIATEIDLNGCESIISTSNDPPIVIDFTNYTIPKSTPFVLEATASDPNQNPLTYTWEQWDNEVGIMPPLPTNEDGPLFRSISPTSSSKRYLPNIADLVNNISPVWEVLPSITRSMEFRITVRNFNSSYGCTAEDNATISSISGSGPFVITSQNSSTTWTTGSTQTILWDVANTNNSPINCLNVEIRLSIDGGNTYPTVLLNSTSNDGAAAITVPSQITSEARVMVKSINNVFFDINNHDITIQGPQVADLIIQNPSVSPTSILPGNQGTVYCKNKNQGTATAGTSWTAVWLSQDQDFDGAPTDINLNADMAVPQLTPGQISNLLSHSITIPSGTPCGNWYIMFGADALGQVNEGSNEGNNQFFIPITISCPLMCNNDYACGPPAPPFLPIYSSCINTSCSTIGATPPSPDIPIICGGNQYQSGRYDDDVWFRITPTNTDEITITVTPTSNLYNFDPVIGLYHGTCSSPTQDGCADLYAEGVPEQIEFIPVAGTTYLIRVFGYDIGSSYSGNFNICVVTAGDPPPPDLVINNISLSDYTLCDDQDFTVSYHIQNVGGEYAPASTVKFYLSTNNSYGSSDDLLGSQSISDLEIGESLNKTKSLSIPAGTDPDEWFILVIADANEVVDEGSAGEQNNLDAIPISVLNCGGVADLIISYDSHTPVVINPGTNVIMNFTAENIGTADAPSCKIGIYTSEDNVFDINTDQYIDDWFQTPLDEGEIDVDGLSFQIPDCHQCGVFYIFLIIDYQLIIPESNENNNEDNFQIEITGCTTCTYSVPPTGITFGSSGGSGSFIVTTTQCCSWTASANQNWVNLFQTSGIGTSAIQYSVEPCNNGSTRTALITVEGQIHEITQSCIETCNSSQSFSWAVQAGSSNLSDDAEDLAIDNSGNLYMTGDIQGSANFGNGIILTTPSNAPDIFVSKHNSAGQILWANNYGNTDQDKGYAINTDSDGNIYVAGYFENTVTFGAYTLTTNVPNDYAAFIIKLNSSGVVQWAKKIHSSYTGIANDLYIDNNNNIYITGDIWDYVGNVDDHFFIAKYNTSGSQLFYYNFGTGNYSKTASGITVDSDENILICGRYTQTITLGSFTLNSLATLDQNGFTTMIDQSGTVIWATALQSPGQGGDWLRSINVDTSNNIYTVGVVDSTAIVGDITIPLSDGSKFIIIKYDTDGNPNWAKASINGFQANRMRIIKSNENDMYVSGGFQTSIQIDSFELASNGSVDAFMFRIDASAKIIWMKGFGGTNSESANGLATDVSNNLFVAGGFYGTVVFDNTVLTSYGSEDIYLAKFIQCDIPPVEVTITGDTVICNGNTSQISTDYCSEIAYQWYRDSISIPGAINPYHIVTEPGLYHVKVSVYPGCDAQSAQIPFYETGSYTFTGNGSWLTASNWINSIIPPTNPPDCYEIIIDHLPGGSCILYTTAELNPGINIIVKPGKSFFIYQD